MNTLRQALSSDGFFVISHWFVWLISLILLAYLPARYIVWVKYTWVADYGVWNTWARWDGWHLIYNALYGYQPDTPFAAFFPLYPWLIRQVMLLTSLNPVQAGLIISHTSLLTASYLLIKLVRLDHPSDIARQTIKYLLYSPVSVFLGVVYTESLFIMLSVLSFYLTRKQKYRWMLAASYLAGLTRHPGLLLTPALLYLVFKQTRSWRKSLFYSSGPVLALVSYMAYLGYRFGQPLKFITDQQFWHKQVSLNIALNFWHYLQYAFGLWSALPDRSNPNALINLIMLISAINLVIWAVRRQIKPASYWIFSSLVLLQAVSINFWASVNRFLVVIFPLFIYLAIRFRQPSVKRSFFWYIYLLLFIFYSVLYFNNFWVG